MTRWPHGAQAACAFTFDLEALPRILDLVEYARRTPRLWLARLDAIAAHARQALA